MSCDHSVHICKPLAAECSGEVESSQGQTLALLPLLTTHLGENCLFPLRTSFLESNFLYNKKSNKKTSFLGNSCLAFFIGL